MMSPQKMIALILFCLGCCYVPTQASAQSWKKEAEKGLQLKSEIGKEFAIRTARDSESFAESVFKEVDFWNKRGTSAWNRYQDLFARYFMLEESMDFLTIWQLNDVSNALKNDAARLSRAEKLATEFRDKYTEALNKLEMAKELGPEYSIDELKNLKQLHQTAVQLFRASKKSIDGNPRKWIRRAGNSIRTIEDFLDEIELKIEMAELELEDRS